MDPVKERPYKQTRSYQLTLTIGKTDYSTDLNRVEILSNITAPWQIIILNMNLDQREVIKKRIYGHEKINLRIQVLGQNAENDSVEDISFDLIQLDDASYATMRQVMSDEQIQPTPLQIVTVVRDSFKTMSTTVNDIVYGATIKDALKKIVGSTNAKLVYDDISSNPEKYDCIFIPPMTLSSAIKFLDDHFGIYNGVSNLGFCNYDNTIYICNLTKKPDSSNWLNIVHLATTSENIQIEEFIKHKTFYTQNPLITKYGGNKILANIGSKIYHITKPRNKLYMEIPLTFNGICEEYGITPDKKVDMFSDPILSDREVYYIATASSGNGSIKPILGRSIIDVSSISTILDRQLLVKPLLKVGEGINLKCNSLDFTELSGKYILKSTFIGFTKGEKTQQEWGAVARINLCRTNKTSS